MQDAAVADAGDDDGGSDGHTLWTRDRTFAIRALPAPRKLLSRASAPPGGVSVKPRVDVRGGKILTLKLACLLRRPVAGWTNTGVSGFRHPAHCRHGQTSASVRV